MNSPPQLDVPFEALPGLVGAAARAVAETDPGPLRAVIALGVAGLGELDSAAVLAELGLRLEAQLTALSLRWHALSGAFAAAAAGYRAVEQSVMWGLP
jgi:hypothetical protein